MITIDSAFCLTLDKRYDLAVKLKESLRTREIEVNLFIAGDGSNKSLKYDFIDDKKLPPYPIDHPYTIKYATWYNRPNAYNAWKCHRRMLLQARGNTLLLEDDSVLSEDFDEIWAKVQPFFSANPWDMIYLGCYHNYVDGVLQTQKTEHPNIMRLYGAGGFHGVIINEKIRKILLNMPEYGPYDWMIGLHHQYHNCYGIHPGIINQTSGYSFVEGHHLDKPDRSKL